VESPLVRKSTLANGVTLLTERLPHRRSVAVGVWVKSGARDEPEELSGISHFLEHMMFKGTERRDARAIAESLESLGGHLDAFTSREQVCFYARVLSENVGEAMDVLADIVCRSRFAEADIRREQQVVREEILAYEDNPEEKLHDILAETVWATHSLGRPILGTVEHVQSFTRPALLGYYTHRYVPAEVVVAAAGDLDHDHVVELVSRHFQLPPAAQIPLSEPPRPVAPRIVHVQRDVLQLYLALGAQSVPHAHPDRFPLMVLNTVFGGGMSSRLFQSVREEAGLAYSIYSHVDFYRDAGLLLVALGVAPETGREALGRVHEELLRMQREGPSEEEVHSGKSQIKGSILLAQESVSNRMNQLALDQIYRGEPMGADYYVEQVMALTRDDVARVAHDYLSPERFTLTALGPLKDGPLSEGDWS